MVELLLILVGVVLDTLQQIESHLLMRHYDGLMDSGRIKGKSAEDICNMIKIKTEEDIELMRASSSLVAKTHAHIASVIKAGITLLSLDKIAEEFIRDNGGIPAFKGYNGFPNTLCISPNEQVVHGIPNHTKAKNGDIISIDCGVYMNGFYGDSAYTYPIGEISEDAQNLLDVTKDSLYKGIETLY